MHCDDRRPPWLQWVIELQSIAQCGLTYAKDVYDIERYQRLRELSAQMLAAVSELPVERVEALFCNETGYQTPKLDTRAAIIQEGCILLVQERSGLWALPGGWVDVLETIRSNAEKEAREEAGLIVRAERIVALQEHNLHNPPSYPYGIVKAFVLCTLLGGAFRPNSETVASGWFAPDALPPLALSKTSPEQIDLCLRAWRDPAWQVVFD